MSIKGNVKKENLVSRTPLNYYIEKKKMLYMLQTCKF